MKKHIFNPCEIIFSVTNKCNLKCEHCFTTKNDESLNAEEAIAFLKTCVGTPVDTVGFSGGEPFLNFDFVKKVVAFAVENDFMFDRIITNGLWWRDEMELKKNIQELYDVKYDGKIAVSFDAFHNQKIEKIIKFINAVYEIFNDENMIEIQSVKKEGVNFSENFEKLPNYLAMKIYQTEQSFPCEDERGWKSKKWFYDDYCEAMGQILYVHANGKIAPCCGFANENDALIIGKITDNYETVMKNAAQNELVNICYVTGLKKEIRKYKKNVHGITSDPCTFCDFLCKIL